MKLIKIILMIIAVVILSYTYSKEISGYNLRAAEEFCGGLDGIHSYKVFPFESVTCVNGKRSQVSDLGIEG